MDKQTNKQRAVEKQAFIRRSKQLQKKSKQENYQEEG